MRSTVVCLALFLCCLSACEEQIDSRRGCLAVASVCDFDAGQMDFCCLAAESGRSRDAVASSAKGDAGVRSARDVTAKPKCKGPGNVAATGNVSVNKCDLEDAGSEECSVRKMCLAALEQALPHKEWEIPDDAAQRRVGVIIASFPNPFRTGSASLFDPALEGLIAALSDERFIRDRSWLWDVPEVERDEEESGGKGDKKSDTAKDGSNKRTKTKVSKTDCSGLLPGVMLFKRDNANSKRGRTDTLAASHSVVVFVVGESPVWGLDERAIHWAKERARKRGRLNIVGPYFSGSATSMANALRDLEYGDVWMASGTMTVTEQAMKLARFNPLFAVDTRAARRATLADFVRDPPARGANDPSAVALFREDATAFGAYSVTEGNWFDFPISPSVSRVRSAHAELQRKRATEAGLRTPPWLDATLDHDPSAPDLLPSTSRNTIIAEDLKFDAIVQTLRQQGISNVGIHLHAAEDVIFVTQHLRQAMPEVRPLLMTMDRTFLHPQYAATMDGALVASAYLELTVDDQGSAKQSGRQTLESGPSGTLQQRDVNSAIEMLETQDVFEATSTDKKSTEEARPATTPMRAFSRDSGPGVYRATQSLFRRLESGVYQEQLSEQQRVSQLGVIRRGKIWPLKSTTYVTSQTVPTLPVEFVALSLLMACIFAIWPSAVKAATALVDGGKIEPQGPGLWFRELSHAAMASGGLACLLAYFVYAWSQWNYVANALVLLYACVAGRVTHLFAAQLGRRSHASAWTRITLVVPVLSMLAMLPGPVLLEGEQNRLLASRTVAVLSGVSPLTETLLGLLSFGVFSAAASVVGVRLSPLGKGIAAFGTFVPLALFSYRIESFGQPHILTVETNSGLGFLMGASLLLSYLVVPLALGALLTAYQERVLEPARAQRKVTLIAVCCVALALFFLGAVNEYPFHPGRVLEAFAAIVLAVTAGCAAFCHSHVAEAKPGAWKVWLWALIPLFIALGAYYPGLRHAIQEWFELRKSMSSML